MLAQRRRDGLWPARRIFETRRGARLSHAPEPGMFVFGDQFVRFDLVVFDDLRAHEDRGARDTVFVQAPKPLGAAARLEDFSGPGNARFNIDETLGCRAETLVGEPFGFFQRGTHAPPFLIGHRPGGDVAVGSFIDEIVCQLTDAQVPLVPDDGEIDHAFRP